jgi:hypothetical protein
MATASTTTVLDILEITMTGTGEFLAYAVVVGFVFAFMLGMFTTVLIILGLWKK